MKAFTYTITDPLGLHARPAGLLVQEARRLADTVVTITKGDRTVQTSRLIQLMGLGVQQGDTVTVTAEGPQEEEALAALRAIFEETL